MTTLHMPVIEPPTLSPDPAAYYAGISAATSLTAATVAHEGIDITISNPSYGKLFAMAGGMLRFVPSGQPLFPGATELATLPGNLSLQIAPLEYDQIRKTAELPTVSHVLYLNVRPNSVRPALDPLLPEVQKLPEKQLLSVWTLPSSPPDLATLAGNYLDAVARGDVTLFVPAGTFIGEATQPGSGQPSTAPVLFTLRMVGPQKGDVSPLHAIRNMPKHGFGGATLWTGHPLIAAVSGISLPIDIFVKFEVWNLSTKAYVPLPAGVSISLMDFDPLSSNDQLDTQNTDANGAVHFHFASLAALAALDPDDTENPDLFFVAHTNGRAHAGHTLPSEWSTKGWKAADGISAGYYENFASSFIGREDAPLVFRIGLDVHLQLQYVHGTTGATEKATKDIPINLRTVSGDDKGTFRTDKDGQVHTVIFDIQPETDLFFVVNFEIEDASIKLPKSTVSIDFWTTLTNDADKTVETFYPSHTLTSIGTQAKPAKLHCSVDERNVALYFLKILRELSTFLFHLTGGSWTGVNNLTLFRTSASGNSYSWPVGSVNIHPSQHWERDTLIHEMSHQIMWKEVNFSSLGIAYQGIFGNLQLYHRVDLLSSPQHAFIEGWAEFMEVVFHARTNPPFTITSLIDTNSKPAGNLLPSPPLPPDGRGESVEGAFANGLWTVFRNQVVAPTGTPSAPLVPESANGDVTTTAPWLTNTTARDKFLALIWNPLKALAPLSSPTTTTMIAQIQSQNPGLWPSVQPDLQKFNMAP
jgi:hypothetical protein